MIPESENFRLGAAGSAVANDALPNVIASPHARAHKRIFIQTSLNRLTLRNSAASCLFLKASETRVQGEPRPDFHCAQPPHDEFIRERSGLNHNVTPNLTE